MTRKPAKEAPAEPKKVAEEAADLLRRGIRALTRQLELLDAMQQKKFDSKRAAQTANLSRALATLTAEARKQSVADRKSVDTMTTEEKVEAIKELLEELPPARRTEMATWLAGKT